MPKVDEAKVLEIFKATQNASEAARQVGCHQNTARAIVRKSRGECTICMEPSAHGRTLCEKCMEVERDRIKERRKKRKRAGVCMECGEPRMVGSLLCEGHRTLALERNDRYERKERALRGSPQGGPMNDQHKRQLMIERYGDAAWERWQRIGGKCETCAAEYGDVAVHLHHIDEDHGNNTPENHVFLCFACHRSVHLLLSSKDRIGLLSWFEKTYPASPLR